jgi:opacity protein-like surface antigen
MALLAMLAAMTCPSARLSAQEGKRGGWAASVHVDVGISATKTNWSLSHPLHSGQRVLWETLRGDGNRPPGTSVGVEFRKDHVAFQGSVGLTSSRLELVSIDENITGLPYEIGRVWEFTTRHLEAAFEYFPSARAGAAVVPLLSGGLGYVGTSGDASMSGGSFSLGGGVRIAISRGVSIDAAVRGRYVRYSGFPLLEPIMAPDLTLTTLSPTVGLRVRI